MPASVPPAKSLPGLAQIFCSATVLTLSEELAVAPPVYVTVATFEIDPAVFGTTVTVMGAEDAPAARDPMLQVTGPTPAQPVCETKEAPIGVASVIVTLLTVAIV